MAKRIQRFFCIAAVFLLVLIVGGYIFLSGYDYNSLKPRIRSALMEATGRELTIGGDIRLELGLTPSLVRTSGRRKSRPPDRPRFYRPSPSNGFR